jgi:hypothetical protein
MPNTKTLVSIVIAIMVIVALAFMISNRSSTTQPSNTVSISVSPGVSGSPVPTKSVNVNINKTGVPVISYPPTLAQTLKGPATCSATGTIKFLQPNLYDNGDALFTYKGIDTDARLVTWTVTPNDDFRIGPNLFNQMPLPDGTSRLAITLPANPKAKHYELTAKVNYGRVVNGQIEVKEANCTGKVIVDLGY